MWVLSIRIRRDETDFRLFTITLIASFGG